MRFPPFAFLAGLGCMAVSFSLIRMTAAEVATAGSDFKVAALRTEYAVNPLGIDAAQPRLFWKIESTARGQKQTAWQILAASSEATLARDDGDLWDSGRVANDRTTFVSYGGKALVSSQTVFWKVRSWDRDGKPSAWSEPAHWTMGILTKEEWKASWIASPAATESLMLRGAFSVKPGLKRALVHATGLGQYELFFNGKKVSDDLLSPGWTNYNVTVLYNTHDVTALLRPGANAAGFVLGNGFYNLAHRDRFTKLTGSFGPLRAIMHLRLEYEDGTVEEVGTNDEWRFKSGPITVGHIFAGEDYDARLAPKGWAEPGFAAAKDWKRAVVLLRPAGQLRGHGVGSEPLRVIDVHKSVAAKTFSDGTVVHDFGQNASHMPRLRVSGPAGSIVRLTPSEVVHEDGTINRNTFDGKNRGNAWWQYTKATDGEEEWFPQFYYIGCRFLKVETFRDESELPHFVPAEDLKRRPTIAAVPRPGDPAKLPTVVSLEMAVVHAIAKPLGEFETSNPLLNRIRDLVRWAQRSNMVSVLSDCPHREKLGWIEQYHLNGPAIRYEYDVARIFTKGIRDMADGQTDDGLIPNIAPEFTVFKGTFRAAAEWGAAFFLVPWQQYEFTGDAGLLREYYPAMKRYFAWLEGRAKDDVLSDGLGDWFDVGPALAGPAQNTPPPVTASAFFYFDAKLMADTAALLGHADEAKEYATKAARILASYNRHFFKAESGTYATGSQAANSLPLVMGIAAPTERARVFSALVKDVEQRGYATTTGDVGFRYSLRALADNGRSDVIYKMVTQEDKPGYAYQLKQGATALTEAWDANLETSHNHFMLGQVTEWFYHDLAGIVSDPAAPGFKNTLIRPQPVPDLGWVKASYDSIHGPISVRWEQKGAQFSLDVSVPANATATVFVPARDGADVFEGGKAAADRPGVKFLRREGDHALYQVESGSYAFTSQR
ncbi:alpha-L-rhamnosidase [Nibricoccus aquaticus]|uniref:alpha-L-rhamnosidase n=1 Tax=Nibricoccus aquaticus TaxID=2576891 RepID=A0A290Q692_9BACT|nr:family 78 glycoside hydrolase catalytic domain [Nibricoccus aquaticus]ATC63953.1 alpha-L-rhamnosidase [Nibricoccus aquaticus]